MYARGDTVARLGGDEFTVLLRNVGDADTTRTIAERVIRSLALPANLGGRDYHMRASVGVTLFPDDGVDLEDIIRQADLAMYRAKAQGRGRAIFPSARWRRSADLHRNGLHRALRRASCACTIQPQFSLADDACAARTRCCAGRRATTASNYPVNSSRPPNTGLITDIGGFVLDSACAQYAEWLHAGIAPRMFSVNVSVQQIKDHNFARMVQGALHQHRHHPCEPRARVRGGGAGGPKSKSRCAPLRPSA